MAVVIKTKNLKWLQDHGAFQIQIQYLEKKDALLQKHGDGSFVITVAGQSWAFIASGPLAPFSEVSSFLSEVISDIEAGSVVKPEPVLTGVVPLREATTLYQRVKGTSKGSVYVVVGVAANDKVKLAAKIDGSNEMALTVRAEGDGLSAAAATLTQHGLSAKNKDGVSYMSGHYACTTEAPPAKVLGSILLGCGLEFKTPLPVIAKIKEGSV